MTTRAKMEYSAKHQLRMLMWNGLKLLTDEECKFLRLYDALCGRLLDTRVLSDEALMRVDYLYCKYTRQRNG